MHAREVENTPLNMAEMARFGRLRMMDWLLLGLRVLVLVVLIHNLHSDPTVEGVIQRFSRIATSHGIPYKDFQVQYMLGELLGILAIASRSLEATAIKLAVGSFAFDIGVFAALRYGWGSSRTRSTSAPTNCLRNVSRHLAPDHRAPPARVVNSFPASLARVCVARLAAGRWRRETTVQQTP